MKSGILIEPKKILLETVFVKNKISKPEFVYNPIMKKLDKPKEIEPETLYEKIINIYNDKNLEEKIITNLFIKIISKFSMENYIIKINKVYNEVNEG